MAQAVTKTISTESFLSKDDIVPLACKVVDRYVYKRVIPEREREDAQMSVAEKFLLKYDQIKSTYSGKASVNTYCVAVMNRMCCEVIRKEVKNWNVLSDDETESTAHDISSADRTVILDEVNLLKSVLLMFDDEHVKLKLFMAYYYQLKLVMQDMADYDVDYIEHRLPALLAVKLGIDKTQIFKNLSRAVWLAEHKEHKRDAIRMWLNKRMHQIIVRLNGDCKRAGYDKETLRLLYEFYYVGKETEV